LKVLVQDVGPPPWILVEPDLSSRTDLTVNARTRSSRDAGEARGRRGSMITM
jgi:hypothetical protein